MSISVCCPHCGKRLKAPDSQRGKAAVCPSCREKFVVSSAEGEPDELALDDLANLANWERQTAALPEQMRPQPQRAAPAPDAADRFLASFSAAAAPVKTLPAESVARIQIGLWIHIYAILPYALFLLLGAASLGALSGSAVLAAYLVESDKIVSNFEGQGPPPLTKGEAARRQLTVQLAAGLAIAAGICMLLSGLPLAAAVLVDIISSAASLWMPAESSARLLVVGSLVAKGIALILFPLGTIVSLFADGLAPILLPALFGLALLIVFFGWSLFIAALTRLAKFFDRADLIAEGWRILAFGLGNALALVIVPLLLILALASGQGIWLLVVVACGGLILLFLSRHDPVTYLAGFALYATGLRFAFDLANFVDSLRTLVSHSATRSQAR